MRLFWEAFWDILDWAILFGLVWVLPMWIAYRAGQSDPEL